MLKTVITKTMPQETAIPNSVKFDEKTNIKPSSLISDEKLETQNGIKNSLRVCQWSVFLLDEDTLSNKPQPITALMPTALIHIFGDESK